MSLFEYLTNTNNINRYYMNQENPTIIETQDLGKKYEEIRTLTNLNLKVKKNSIFGFLDPNGAGKTTTIKLLLDLIKPTNGSAKLFNYDVIHNSIKIRSRVGYLPQNPSFYENITAREILEFSIKFYSINHFTNIFYKYICNPISILGNLEI